MARVKRVEDRPTDLAGRLAAKYEALDSGLPTEGMWAEYLRKQSRFDRVARDLRAGATVRFRGWQLQRFVAEAELGGLYLVTGDSFMPVSREEYMNGHSEKEER